MTFEEMVQMVVRHDEHLRNLNGDIAEIKEELKASRQAHVESLRSTKATLIAALTSVLLTLVQMVAFMRQLP